MPCQREDLLREAAGMQGLDGNDLRILLALHRAGSLAGAARPCCGNAIPASNWR